MDYGKMAVDLHRKTRGKISMHSKVPLESVLDMSLAYTPGVAQVSLDVAADKAQAYELTNKGNMVAVVSDGSAVLGLGNIGPEGAMPVMEGKAVLFRELAGIRRLAHLPCHPGRGRDHHDRAEPRPTFGGINLEDISAPRCFYIEENLMDIGIPVFHDDQHGTAVVVLAAVINALQVVGKRFEDVKVVFSGAGASGIACAQILQEMGTTNIVLVDSRGAIYKGRDNLNSMKEKIADTTNFNQEKGSVHDVIKGADMFIGLSTKDLIDADDVRNMNSDAIVLAMANPDPEIMPDEAERGGAKVIGTGRSDLQNQVNNVLGFPGIFRGALDARAERVTMGMKIAAGQAIANCIEEPTPEEIIPYALNTAVVPAVAEAVAQAWRAESS